MNVNNNSQWPRPGTYRGIPYTQYATLQAVNATLLKAVATMPPGKALFSVQNRKQTPDTFAGLVLHSYLLDPPEMFARNYPRAEPCGSLLKTGKSAGKPCGAATAKLVSEGWRCATHAESGVIGEGVNAELMGLVEAVQPEVWRVAKKQMNYPEAELTLVWKDEKTGLLCKARLDLCDPVALAIADLKKTRYADADWFGGAVGTYGYHIQDAWYRRGAAACIGKGIWNFDFVAIELNKKERNGVQVLTLGDEARKLGEATAQSALEVVAMCQREGVWPLYTVEPKLVKMRPWMVRAADELNG